MPGRLFIISAPSGAGKTTLVERLIDCIRCHYPIKRIITYTSKTARSNEQNGQDYHFLSADEFRHKIENGFFMEWSDAYGCYYGSPRSILDEVEQGGFYILVIDRIGAERVAQLCDNAVLIWLYTKGLEVLRERLEQRNTEKQGEIEHRLDCARREIEQELRCPIYHYHVLNDDFNRALRKLEKIICHELTRAGSLW